MLGEPPWAPRCWYSRYAGLPVRETLRHQRIPRVTGGVGTEGSLIFGEGPREQPLPGAQGRGCPSSETRAPFCGTFAAGQGLRDPRPPIP